MTSQPNAPRSTTPSVSQPPGASAWVGWIAFAAVCLSLLGSFHVVQGLLGGAVLIVAGLCVFAGQTWARAVGVLMAVGSLVGSFAFVGAYPVFSLVMISLGIVVILALTVHGSDIKP